MNKHQDDLELSERGQINETHIYQAAYNYFEYHAKQRTDMFNYFVIIYGALWTALVTVLTRNNTLTMSIIAGLITIFQIIIVVIFYKIDGRNKFLVEHGEYILKKFEKDLSSRKPYMKKFSLFAIEKVKFDKFKDEKTNNPPFRASTFSECVKYFYFTCMIFSLIAFVAVVILLIPHIYNYSALHPLIEDLVDEML